MEEDVVAQAYAVLADRYIDLFASGEHEHPDDVHLIVDHLGGLTGPVLDLGCGPGHLTGLLRSHSTDVTGIDVVPAFLAYARQAHPTARFERGSITNLSRPHASVAGVLSWYSLIHVHPDDLGQALAEIRRVMVPGGVAVFGFFEGPTREPFEHKVVTAYRWPVDEFAARVAEAGFEEVTRLTRPQRAERRPHAALVATAV